MAHYDVWDTDTNNVVGHYTSEDDALRFVRDLLDTYGDAYADDLQLGGRDNADRIFPPLGGAGLVAKARTAKTSRSERDEQRQVD